ncbi:MAG: HRDC domain-containing protein [Nitriliruptoraceae bacterium]
MAAQDGTRTATAPTITFVDEPDRVRAGLAAVDVEVVGVDVERADADRYFRRAALIQVGADDHCVLLDAVTLPALPQLDALLDDRHLAVLHAADNDLEPLAHLGVRPARVADTAIAATLLGLPTGLSKLLDEVLGVELSAEKESFQRADWEQRPLPADMAAYAAGDVVHLPALWSALAARLDRAGRRSWYEEELAVILDQSAGDTRDWTRVKGAGRLDPGQRALLRALWEAREAEARAHDIAPNRLVHDEVLRDLATDPPRTPAQLVRRSPRRRSLLRAHADALFAAVEAGLAAEPIAKPRSARWSETERTIFDALRTRRAAVAEEHGLPAGVLCPSKVLWAAVDGAPGDGHELCALAGLRGWQTGLLAAPLWEAYVAARDRPAAD